MQNFLRLIRFPNLLIMVFGQVLVQTCLIFPEKAFNEALSARFWLLTFSTVLIAAGGYIINDYYDIKIDAINKPDKIVVGRNLNRRKAMLVHIILSVAGVLLGAWLSLKVGLVNLGVVLLLWGYSADLKRRLLSGNITIAFLGAVMVLVVSVFNNIDTLAVWAFAAFAFVTTLIREIMKDVEDMKGDAAHDCRTLPIVAGVPATKYVLLGLLLLFYTLVVLSVLYRRADVWFGIYLLLAVFVPGVYAGILLKSADKKSDFAKLSGWFKLIMFTGMLSMLFFRF